MVYNVFRLPRSAKKKQKLQQNLKLLKKFINEKKRREILITNYNFFSDLLTSIKKYIYIFFRMNKFVLIPHEQYDSFKTFNKEKNKPAISEEKVVDLKPGDSQNTVLRLYDNPSL